MTSAPRELAYRMSGQAAAQTMVLPLGEARRRAREIIGGRPDSRQLAVIENWQQRPDGQIEFTVRTLVAAD